MRLITTTVVELTPEELAALRRRRGDRKLETLARKIGVGTSTLAYWERGDHKPSLDMYRYWIEALRLLDAANEKAAA